jgi:hypothetical protein
MVSWVPSALDVTEMDFRKVGKGDASSALRESFQAPVLFSPHNGVYG